MLVISTRRPPLTSRKEVWFHRGETFEPGWNNQFRHSHQSPPADAKEIQEVWTSVVDLRRALHELESDLQPRLRSYLRQRVAVVVGELQIEDEFWRMLFVRSHREFAGFKGQKPLSIRRVDHLTSTGKFRVTAASYGGRMLSFHSYLVDGERVRLLTSHTRIGRHDPKLLGLLTKIHYWEDILRFREQGFEEYDFGGVRIDPQCGISRLKRSFGGNLEKNQDYVLPRGPYRLIYLLRKTWNWLRTS